MYVKIFFENNKIIIINYIINKTRQFTNETAKNIIVIKIIKTFMNVYV